jgi:hypothetical protein
MKKSLIETLILLLTTALLPTILYSQKVGIGTSAPAFKLDVRNGSINTDSVYRIGGATFLSWKAGNVLLGAGDGVNLTTGIFNVAIGLALEGTSTGSNNIGIGFNALDRNSTASFNVALGFRALEMNTVSRNTAVGSDALSNNTTGTLNTALGAFALNQNATGTQNTAVGYNALRSLTGNGRNTAVGQDALQANTGWQNTAVGSEALSSNTIGESNVGIGYQALKSNTSGNYNVAVGTGALNSNTGSSNTAVGFYALPANGAATHNTAMGFYALHLNQTGTSNCAFGSNALYFITNSENTAMGTNAMFRAKNTRFNTAVGFNAAATYDIGFNNTVIGAQADLSFDAQYNSIAIGNLAVATDNSKVSIGNYANWSYEAYANWTNISDSRYKKNIVEDVAGLDFIKRLRPVTYQLDVTALSQKNNTASANGLNDAMKIAIAEKEKMVWTGFIAQEVEEAARLSGFNFSGVDKPRNEHGTYGLRYAEFVVPLVKAVQEQQQMIEELKKELAALKREAKLIK